MKRVLAAAAVLLLILGFQNCSQKSLQVDGSVASSEVTVSLPQGGGEATSVAKVTYVEIPEIADSANAYQKASVGSGSERLVISLDSGVIQLMDDANNALDKRCLSSSDLEELKNILAGSRICEAQVPGDAICAMRMKTAYASLFANEQRVNLGEERDSCGTGRKDLCGQLSDVFQAYVTHVKEHWSEMNCQ